MNTDDHKKQLSSNIKMLGDLLGKTIIQQVGQDVFDLEERIRGLSKQWRSGDQAANSELGQIVLEITGDLDLTIAIIKAFSTYFQLVNIAEEHERIRILRERNNRAFVTGEPMDESVACAIATLKREGLTANDVQAMLDDLLIMPVFTAHPTESRRRTTRQILERVSGTLDEIQSPSTLEQHRSKLVERLHGLVTLLWQSDDNRDRRPTVMDEVRNTGLYFFEDTLFDVVPQIYDELSEALNRNYPDFEFTVPTFLKYGSWIGGDRDGNPLVTNQVTEDAIRAQKDLALKRYSNDVYELYRLLASSRDRAEFDSEFMSRLEQALKSLNKVEAQHLSRFHQEPYRQWLILVYRRLMATSELNRQSWDHVQTNPRAYSDASELIEDLQLIQRSLQNNKGGLLVAGGLQSLLRRVEIFGFRLASLDIRQHSERHLNAIAEIFTRYSVCDDYVTLDEDTKIEVLSREIENQRPLTAQLDFSEATNEIISLLRLVRQSHSVVGQESIQVYVISMTKHCSDLLGLLLLMSDAGLFGKLDVVPLFETVDDLQNAPHVMDQLFSNPIYQKHLAARGNQQQIMIGYSDSNKDGGYLRANWMLFIAQRRLAETCNKNGIKLTLFHGRGGSLGRGGGPANQAILAQPPESIKGRIRITEQGEVVSSRYSHPEIAQRHLQQLVHAVICSGGKRPRYEKLDRWGEIMDELSQLAFVKYRSLVEHPNFVEYFEAASPIDQIGKLNIGSRPARRKSSKNLDDLRAIPWVFAWTQSRTNVPSWYGIGTAFKEWIGTSQEQLAEVQEMYETWPFFKTLLNNVHAGLGRTEIEISQLYSQLADEQHRIIFDDLRAEYEITRAKIVEVTKTSEILDTEKWLQHSIKVRNPYVDPLNYFQIALLEKIRADKELSDESIVLLQRALANSVSGIAAGLQKVG